MYRISASPLLFLTAVKVVLRHSRPFALALMLGAAMSACASSGATSPRRSLDVITQAEMTATNLPSVYEAVQRLRPQWLRGRGSTSSMNNDPALPVIYVSGMRQGGPEALRSLRTNDVSEVRFISASDATTRWGTGHIGGAIEVIVR